MLGVSISSSARFLLMLPLCLAVALVYKTTRMDNLQGLVAATGVLWITIVLSMYAVGIGLWLFFSLTA
ncbi:MAG: hypothetical protein ACYTHJ_14750 [Planctomycetota bacterium]|jgi:hypothetical protein